MLPRVPSNEVLIPEDGLEFTVKGLWCRMLPRVPSHEVLIPEGGFEFTVKGLVFRVESLYGLGVMV